MAERDLSISKKKRIGSILLRSELAAGELAVNWQPTSAGINSEVCMFSALLRALTTTNDLVIGTKPGLWV